MVADDNYPRGNWPLAHVVETYTGPDGLVRVAKVKTTSTVATYSKRKRKREVYPVSPTQRNNTTISTFLIRLLAAAPD